MSVWNANIEALRAVGSDLPGRLMSEASVPHIERDETGLYWYRIHRTRVKLRLPEPSVTHGLAALSADTTQVLLFGLGLGELLGAALERTESTRIVAWERDPVLLQLCLRHVDCAAAIRSGRLTLLLGADLVDRNAYGDTETVYHPLLRQFYWREQDWLEGDPGRPVALIAAGTLFVDDLAKALIAESHATWTVDLEGLSEAELARTIDGSSAILLAAINYTNGLAELCAAHELALLVWEIDPAIEPIQALLGEAGKAHIFTWCRSNVAEWQKAGFDSVHYLPLAANPEHRRPTRLSSAEQDRYRAEICFVGSSMLGQVAEFRRTMEAAVAEWLRRRGQDPGQAGALIDAILKHQRAELQRYVIPALVEGAMPGFLAEMKALGKRFDPVAMLGELAAAERRLSVVASMGELGIQVWGDPGWRAAQSYGARFRGSAGHRDELTRIYNAVKIQVDIGRIYQLDIVTMRVFDVIACGGFVIAERNEALFELFEEGVEIETWRHVEDLKQKCRHYLAHPEAAAEIARRGRERLMKDHSIRVRLRRMLEVSGAVG